MTEQQIHELFDLLESLRHKIDIATLLLHLGKESLLPTILKAAYEDAQKIIDDYCIKKERL